MAFPYRGRETQPGEHERTTTDEPTATIADLAPLEEHCEWTRDSLGDSFHELSPEHVAEVEAALAHAEAHTVDVLDVTRADFPLPTLGPMLGDLTDDLINGRGVALLRGLPVERYTKDQASVM